MTRVAAVQSWPELKKPAVLTQLLTASRSASSKTTTGALPPSSRWTRFNVCVAAFATSLPVATSPVSDTMSTPGWRTIPAPRLAVAGNDVEDARGEDVRGQLRQSQRGQRRPLGGLQHHAVSGSQRRPHLPDRHHQRIVPGRDRAHHAHRLPPDHAGVAAHVLAGGLAFEQSCCPGEEAKVVDTGGQLVREEEG